MSRPAYRLVRDTLILERAKIVMDRPMAKSRFPGMGLIERMRQRHRHQQAVARHVMDPKMSKYVTGLVEEVTPAAKKPDLVRDELPPPVATPVAAKTMTERLREESGTALATPRTPESRNRTR